MENEVQLVVLWRVSGLLAYLHRIVEIRAKVVDTATGPDSR